MSCAFGSALFTPPDALQAFAFASAVASAAGGTAPFTSALAQASAQVQPQLVERLLSASPRMRLSAECCLLAQADAPLHSC